MGTDRTATKEQGTKMQSVNAFAGPSLARRRSLPPPTLLAIVVALAAGCTTTSAQVIASSDRSQDELLSILARIAREGATTICSPRSLERALDVQIGKPDLHIGPEVLDQPIVDETSSVISVGTKTRVRGIYQRFRSATTTTCSLGLELLSVLCDVNSAHVRQVMGEQPREGIASPHRSDSAIEYAYTGADGTQTEVILGSAAARCTSKISLHATGEWH